MGPPMNTLAHRLLFTKKLSISKDPMGNDIEIEGVFFNRLGRNLPLRVVVSWVAVALLSV